MITDFTATATSDSMLLDLEKVKQTLGKADDNLLVMECILRHVADVLKDVRVKYIDPDGTWIDKLSLLEGIGIVNQMYQYVKEGVEKCTGKPLTLKIQNKIVILILQALGIEL